MICPECGSEYREGFVRCSDCEVDLVEPEPVEPEVELVKVYETGNAAIIPLFESMLQEAGIEYMTKGEAIQDLFGAGRFGTGLNFAIGPVEFYVRADAAADAREIVAALEAPATEDADDSQ